MDPENLLLSEGFDAVTIALKSGRVCDIFDFFPSAEKPSSLPLQVKVEREGKKQKIRNIYSAEQFIMLAHSGLVEDKRCLR